MHRAKALRVVREVAPFHGALDVAFDFNGMRISVSVIPPIVLAAKPFRQDLAVASGHSTAILHKEKEMTADLRRGPKPFVNLTIISNFRSPRGS